MTYYGRWTYKYEIASEKGAAAVILVHETEPARLSLRGRQGSWSRENFDIAQPRSGPARHPAAPPGARGPNRVEIEGWITYDKAKELFQASGRDLEAPKKAVDSPRFSARAASCQAQFAITNTLREVQLRNVVAKLEGSDRSLKDETVVYTAHWDHLGRDPVLSGTDFNGAAGQRLGRRLGTGDRPA